VQLGPEAESMQAHEQKVMQDRPAKSLCMDHTFEVAKRNRNPDGSQAYCALFSMMNEQVSIAFKAFVRSKSLEEVVEKLEEWRDHQIEIGNEVREAFMLILLNAKLAGSLEKDSVFSRQCLSYIAFSLADKRLIRLGPVFFFARSF
jgi:hypothetical protein